MYNNECDVRILLTEGTFVKIPWLEMASLSDIL